MLPDIKWQYISKNRKPDDVKWKTVLNEWMKLNILYSEVSRGDDCSYIHGEHSNCSLFNCALFNCRYPSIMESRIGKGEINGRSDICFRAKNHNTWRYLEAKFVRVALQSFNENKFDRKFFDSYDDVRKVASNQIYNLCFFAFTSMDFLNDEDLIEHIEILKKYAKSISDFASFVSPSVSRSRKLSQFDDHYAIGVLVIGSKVCQKNRP